MAAAVARARGGVYLNVHVQPGAKRGGVCGLHGDAIKIAVRERAQDGKANRALIELIAEGLGLPKAAVRLAGGASSRRKRVWIGGPAEDVMRRLHAWLADG